MDNCIICLDSIESTSKNYVATECGHLFHFCCLKPCIKKCPLCRLSLHNDKPPTDLCDVCRRFHSLPMCRQSPPLEAYHISGLLCTVTYASMYLIIALRSFSLVKDPSSVLTKLSHCAFVTFCITHLLLPATSRMRIVLSSLLVWNYFMFNDQFAHVLLIFINNF